MDRCFLKINPLSIFLYNSIFVEHKLNSLEKLSYNFQKNTIKFNRCFPSYLCMGQKFPYYLFIEYPYYFSLIINRPIYKAITTKEKNKIELYG